MFGLKSKKQPLVEDGIRYVVRVDNRNLETFLTREDARNYKRSLARAVSQPQPEIVAHEFKDGYELPPRIVT